MTTYCITSPHFCAAIVTSNDTVVQAAPILRWTIGKSFTIVRDYCRKRGWSIEPEPDEYHPQWLEYEGRAYELHWDGNVLKRITEHGNDGHTDLTYDKIPEPLKGTLYGENE